LLNISGEHNDMYNHGLSTFVLGQAYGMTSDPRVGPVLDRALKVIIRSQCNDGGWQYEAWMEPTYDRSGGHDLSLAVMQAKALRSAVDSGFEIPPSVIETAIRDVREHYSAQRGRIGLGLLGLRDLPQDDQAKPDGRFTYRKGGGQATLALAAAGVVCLQEFAQYDDWRIPKNVEIIEAAVLQMEKRGRGSPPYDPYTMYYVAQALYQVGGEPWKRCYPILRDRLVSSQMPDGEWPASSQVSGAGLVSGQAGVLYQTAVACFVLAIPNRYLPILQEGKIDSLRKQFEKQ
jgi:hypothetical protein